MTAYFIRRFLLVIPTFLGITLAVFVIMHFVPGGPVERRIMQFQMSAMREGGDTGVPIVLSQPDAPASLALREAASKVSQATKSKVGKPLTLMTAPPS